MTIAKTKTAQHRPAVRRRRFRHDELTAVDLMSGYGGLTQGIENAGFTAIVAANHDEYKVEIHEANHPHVEHWIADLVDTTSPAYHSVRDLPAADLLSAGVSCKNHTQANSQRAYEQGLSLFDIDDPEFDEQVTRSERDRATANCVLHYAAQHHPRLILVECTTEIQCWGPQVPGKKYGDGTTYRWWLNEFVKLGYSYKVLYLNNRFFDGDQSRDRWFGAFWDQRIPTPDLEHRPESWCDRCQTIVEARQTLKTGVPPTGSVRYGKQYNYRCPSCHTEVIPPSGYALRSLDLSDLGTRIGDKPLKEFKDKQTGEIVRSPMAPATMARAERCRQRFAEFPAVLMPAKAQRGSERHPWQPMATQTSQQETAVLSTGAVMVAAGNTYERPGSDCRTRDLSEPLWSQTGTNTTGLITPPVAIAVDNYQGAPRGVDEPLPTQVGAETMAVLSSGIVPFRQNTVPTTHAEPMPTVTADQIPGLITAAGRIQNNGSIDEAAYRTYPVDEPLGTVTASAVQQGLLFSGWYKQNGSTGSETAPHPLSDPLGTLTGNDTTGILSAEWREALADLALEDCDGFGNAVFPPIGMWISERLRRALHGEAAA